MSALIVREMKISNEPEPIESFVRSLVRPFVRSFHRSIDRSTIILMWSSLFFVSESSQCYVNDGSPDEGLTDDEENGINHHSNNDRDGRASPNTISPSDYHQQQSINRSDSLSPLQMSAINSTDDGSTANAVKVEQENDFHCSSPSRSPSRQNISSKVAISTNLLASSSSANKRLTGTLNRLLHSVVNRPNGHHYHHLNGLSSSPSASSSTATTALPIDSSGKDGKLALEMTTAAIESTF